MDTISFSLLTFSTDNAILLIEIRLEGRVRGNESKIQLVCGDVGLFLCRKSNRVSPTSLPSIFQH